MPTVSVHVDASDVLEELSDEDLQEEVERRKRPETPVAGCREVRDVDLLEQVWAHFRGRDDAPQCLREYVWRLLGKVL